MLEKIITKILNKKLGDQKLKIKNEEYDATIEKIMMDCNEYEYEAIEKTIIEWINDTKMYYPETFC